MTDRWYQRRRPCPGWFSVLALWEVSQRSPDGKSQKSEAREKYEFLAQPTGDGRLRLGPAERIDLGALRAKLEVHPDGWVRITKPGQAVSLGAFQATLRDAVAVLGRPTAETRSAAVEVTLDLAGPVPKDFFLEDDWGQLHRVEGGQIKLVLAGIPVARP